MGFILFWEIEVNGELIEKKMDVKLPEGDFVRIVNKEDEAEILFLASRALNEPVTWARPIVMNTRAVSFLEISIFQIFRVKLVKLESYRLNSVLILNDFDEKHSSLEGEVLAGQYFDFELK